MNDDWQQLRHVLQVLALPVIGQVRLLEGDSTRISLLVEAFNSAHHAVNEEMGTSLTPAQKTALARLEKQLTWLCSETDSPLCSEQALRQSCEWRQVRLMARAALVHFRWPLEAPPLEALSQNFCLS